MSKITIITVCFNSEKTIIDTLESMYQQSLQDYEYIIIDGKSTDKTLEIIKNYQSKFRDRLRVISEPDKGLYDAMNKGIQLSSGDIIGILNSDDWYENNALEIVRDFFGNSETDILAGKMKLVTYDKKFIRICKNKEICANIYKSMPVNHPATFVKRDVYKEIGLFDISYKLSADYDFVYRAYVNNKKFDYCEEVLSNMRLGGKTSGMGGVDGLKSAFIAAKEDYLLKFKNTGHRYWKIYYKTICILYLRQLKRYFIKSKYDC